MFVSSDYREARERAQHDADTYQRPMGLERAVEFGRTVYRVKMIPVRAEQRFGWELRCEVVEPTHTPDLCIWCSTEPASPAHFPYCSTACSVQAACDSK